jgi:hypothetical protein
LDLKAELQGLALGQEPKSKQKPQTKPLGKKQAMVASSEEVRMDDIQALLQDPPNDADVTLTEDDWKDEELVVSAGVL